MHFWGIRRRFRVYELTQVRAHRLDRCVTVGGKVMQLHATQVEWCVPAESVGVKRTLGERSFLRVIEVDGEGRESWRFGVDFFVAEKIGGGFCMGGGGCHFVKMDLILWSEKGIHQLDVLRREGAIDVIPQFTHRVWS